jgi:UDP-N-acetylmuramate--alanine ligase
MEADLDPTVIVGGMLPSLGGNGRFGEGDYFVVEADEYDHMFLGLKPEVAVILNIEHDHPDIYPSEEEYRAAFAQFARLLPEGGRLMLCADRRGNVQTHAERSAAGRRRNYHVRHQHASDTIRFKADYLALDCAPTSWAAWISSWKTDGQLIGLARLRVPGTHNVRNALAAIIVGHRFGHGFCHHPPGAGRALAAWERRFQVVGEVGGVTVIDDYAHHPTEIQATLAAARQRFPGRRIGPCGSRTPTAAPACCWNSLPKVLTRPTG